MKCKYIVTNHGGFAIFDLGQTHKDIARGLYGIPVGAGMCHITANSDGCANVHCYGESITLKIKSRKEEDEKIINRRIKL